MEAITLMVIIGIVGFAIYRFRKLKKDADSQPERKWTAKPPIVKDKHIEDIQKVMDKKEDSMFMKYDDKSKHQKEIEDDTAMSEEIMKNNKKLR